MGVEHPTRTDTKVETDQPGPPGQKSGPEGRDATQQPGGSGTDQKGETPTPARSARAENSNDPNDDPNRIGTPRADSLAIARGEKPEPPADKGETPTPARSIRAENSNDPNDDPNRIGTPRADSLAIARGEKPEPPAQKQEAEITAGTPEPLAERPPGTSGTPRADSMAIARGEKLETDENETEAADTDPPDAPMKRPGEAEPPADNREPDSADPSGPGEQGAETTDTTADAPDPHAASMAPGEQPLGEQGTEASKQDNPSHPEPQEDRPPAPEAIKTDEPDDVTPEPDGGTGQTPPQDAQPLDHGILDDRAEDVERPAETNPEVADGKPPAETGEQLGDAPPPPEPEPDAEAPPAPTDGEPTLQPEPGAIEEPEPPTDVEDDLGSEPEESKDAPAQGAVGGSIGESDDAGHGHGKKAEDPAEPSIPEEENDPFASLPTREDLDPVGENDPAPDLEEAKEDAPPGEDPEREHLYSFGNKKMPKLTRLDKDLRVESSDEIVGPYTPESPTDRVLGKSTYIDPMMTPLTGHFHVLAPEAEIPPGLGIHADGEDAGGIEPWGHRTIYPTEPMTAGEFRDRVAALDWEWAGNKKR